MVILTFIIATRQVFGQFFQRGQFWLEPVLQPFFTICVNLLQSDSGLHRGQLELLQNRLDAKPSNENRAKHGDQRLVAGKPPFETTTLSILDLLATTIEGGAIGKPQYKRQGGSGCDKGERIPMIRHSGTNRYATTMACVISSLPCFDFQRKTERNCAAVSSAGCRWS